MNRRHLRTRRRKGQRGAALVEAAVVIPTFILLLSGMLFFHSLIWHTQKTLRESRRMAWTSAMAGCSGAAVAPPALNSNMGGAPGSEASLSEGMGQASSEVSGFASVTVGGGNGAGGIAFSQQVSANTTVFCNNVTRPGDVGGVFGYLFGAGGGFGAILGNLF